MVFLDTHVAVWLFAEVDRIPAPLRSFLDRSDLFVSPMARLELAFLHEIGRVRDPEAATGKMKENTQSSLKYMFIPITH